MIYDLIVKETAKHNIIDAFLYYEGQQKGLGERFLDCWENHLEILQQEPKLYQKKYKDFRQLLVKPYPYHIIFEIENNSIVIYKVIYAGRHPNKRYAKK